MCALLKRLGFCFEVVVRGFRMPRSYSREFRDRAVRFVEDRVREGSMESQTQAILDTAVKLGVAREALRRWVV